MQASDINTEYELSFHTQLIGYTTSIYDAPDILQLKYNNFSLQKSAENDENSEAKASQATMLERDAKL
jgi:hypothetical protein